MKCVGLFTTVCMSVAWVPVSMRAADVHTISVTLTAPAAEVTADADGTHRVRMEGLRHSRLPGDPLLPFKCALVLLPPDIVWESLKLRIVSAQEETLDGTYTVAPAPPDMENADGKTREFWGPHDNVVDRRNQDVYGCDAVFPAKQIELRPLCQKRKWKMAPVVFNAVRYNPVSGALTVCRKAVIELAFERDAARVNPQALQDTIMDASIPTMVENYDQAVQWYAAPKAKSGKTSEVTDYVIITRQIIVNNSTNLDAFVQHKVLRGHSVRVIVEDDFNVASGVSPDSWAERIRKWLMDHYLSDGIQYVLLIGDPQPVSPYPTWAIPMKMCWPEGSIPTDYYYADLTGNWDLNENGYFGDLQDWFGGGVDLIADVWVGRIPVYGEVTADIASLDSILQKIMDYEDEELTGWRKSCLMPGSFMSEHFCGGRILDQLRDYVLLDWNYDTWRMYQQGNGAGGYDSPWDSEEELLPGNYVQDRWTTQAWGIVTWVGHGNATTVGVGFGANEEGTLFSSWKAPYLDDDHPSFVCAAFSCQNAWPESKNNLMYALLKNGAIASAGNTRNSRYNPDQQYGDFDGSRYGLLYEYSKRIAYEQPAGQALWEAKEAVAPDVWMLSQSGLINMYGLVLYGDPSVGIRNAGVHKADMRFSAATLTITDTVVDIDVTVINDNGHATAPECRIGFYLSQDGYITETDHLIGTAIVPSKGPQAEYSTGLHKDIRLVTPKVPQGVYYVGVMVDIDDTVVEDAGEYNNAYAFEATQRVTMPPGHDAPTGVAATDGTLNHIRVSWDPAPGATHYRVFRNTYDGTIDAIVVSDWVSDTYVSDWSADVGRAYYYMVRSGVSGSGANAGPYSARDRGFREAPELEENAAPILSTGAFYQFTETHTGWCAIGKRAFGDEDNLWGLGLYSDAGFDSELKNVPSSPGTSFVLVDLRKVEQDSFAVKIWPDDNLPGDAALTYDVADEPARSTGVWIQAWNDAGTDPDVVKVFDLALSPGTYRVRVARKNNNVTPFAALFSSEFRTFYQTHEDFVAQATGSDTEKSFTYTVVTEQTFGLCVWGEGTGLIDISVEERYPGLWEGGVSTLWSTPGNWNDGTVPTASVDVTIPPGKPRYPVVPSAADCRSLTLESGTLLSVSGSLLDVVSSVIVRGNLVLGASAVVDVGGSVIWEPGSTGSLHPSALMKVARDWRYHDGAGAALDTGTVRFDGTSSSWIECADPACRMPYVQNRKDDATFLGVSARSSAPLRMRSFVNGTSGSDVQFWSFSPHAVIVDGVFDNLANVHMFNGALVIEGDPSATPLKMSPESELYSLEVRTTAPLTVSDTYTNALTLWGDLVIESGGLDAEGIDIRIDGSWSNALGSAGYAPGDGAVTFAGSRDQHVYGSNVFHTLNIDKTGGTVMFHGPVEILGDASFAGATCLVVESAGALSASPAGKGTTRLATVSTVGSVLNVPGTLDLSDPSAELIAGENGRITIGNLKMGGTIGCVSNGLFVADDIVDGGLRGTIRISGGQMDLHQGTTVQETLDLEGVVVISGGVLNIHGGSTPLRWIPRNNDLDFTMSGGELNVIDGGIWIWNGGGTLTGDISGGIMRSAGDFDCDRSDFRPAGGTLVMADPTPSVIDVTAPSYLHSLRIDAPLGVVPATDLTVNGDFTISTGWFRAPAVMSVGGSWSNGIGPAAFQEGTGKVEFVGGTKAAIVTDEDFFHVDVAKTSTAFDGLTVRSNLSVNVYGDLSVLDGSFELDSWSHLAISGDLLIERGAGLNANDREVHIDIGGNWVNRNVDLGGIRGFFPGDELYGSSVVTFKGRSTQTLETAAPEERFVHLVINKVALGGDSRFEPAADLHVEGTCTVSNGIWVTPRSGLTYTINDDFTILPAGKFDGDASTLRFEGVKDQVLSDQSLASAFGNFVVARSESAAVTELATMLHCSAGHSVAVDHGTLDLAGQTLACEGLLDINDGATLVLSGGSSLQMGDGQSLSVNAGGRLQAIGGGRSGDAVVGGYRGGRYRLLVGNGGEIAAEETTFADMDANGVVIASGARIDSALPFSRCTFRDGATGGILLTVSNSQSLVIERAKFPTSADRGSGNVRRTSSRGQLDFVAASGVFSGELYDDDPFNTVNWFTGGPVSLLVSGPSHCTKGGSYEFEATANGEHMFHPLSFRWQMTGHFPFEHGVKGESDLRNVTWPTPGRKTVRVIVSNSEGTVTNTHSVSVLQLELTGIEWAKNHSGSNAVVNLAIGGTSSHSDYRVEFSSALGAGWSNAIPDTGVIRGANGTTPWQDDGGTGGNLKNGYYRAILVK